MTGSSSGTHLHFGSGRPVRHVSRSCPNAREGQVTACNCIGACQPIVVAADDPRTDDQVREDYKRRADELLRTWDAP